MLKSGRDGQTWQNTITKYHEDQGIKIKYIILLQSIDLKYKYCILNIQNTKYICKYLLNLNNIFSNGKSVLLAITVLLCLFTSFYISWMHWL